MSPGFVQYYAHAYDVSIADAEARIELIEALRPHLHALRSIGRQRYAMLIDKSADEKPRKALMLVGAAKETVGFADAMEAHIATVDQLASEYAEALHVQEEAH